MNPIDLKSHANPTPSSNINQFIKTVYKSTKSTTSGCKSNKPTTLFPQAIHAERFRTRDPLHGEAEQISALAFYMDKDLAYIPALHYGYHPSQAKACASLDFSLRFFEHEVKLEDWHYTEQKTLVANHAMAYSEGRVWDSRGRLLASMTQQTILRPDSGIKSRL